MSEQAGSGTHRIVILGGGVAGLEALLALHDLAGPSAEITLVAPRPDFLYKPLLVEEPFGLDPAERHELGPLAEELGASFVQAAAKGVAPERHAVELADGPELEYDYLVVCLGGRYRPALERATTFPSDREPLRIDEILAGEGPRRVAFVVPYGVTWALPLYEIALMAERRVRELALHDVRLTIVTPEDAPLAVFGPAASAALAEMLSTRGIELELAVRAHESEGGGLVLAPGDRQLDADRVIALPVMDGPGIPGLPSDERGFLPIDDQARVEGVEDVYAAGDGTNFPIKQGGLGTQQADAAAEDIAHRIGASGPGEPFRPVLRGKLLTGDESVSMRAEVAGGGGEGEVSPDCLWWPPHKISGRYLAPWLYGSRGGVEPEAPSTPLDVEVSLPKEWHAQPMGFDPDGSPPRD